MARLVPGDEAATCDWCGLGVSEDDIVETNDGSEICPECVQHYDSNV